MAKTTTNKLGRHNNVISNQSPWIYHSYSTKFPCNI